MAENKFYTRGFITLVTALSFVVMTVTGIVLYFVPQGRIAYWTKWKFLLLSKDDWGNIHITSSILFALCAAYHLYFNWKAFLNYIVDKISKAVSHKNELALATVITLFIFFGTLYLVPPLNYVIQFSDYLKASWVESKEYEPPFGHAEQLSLKVLAKKTNIDLRMAMAELRDQGIEFESENMTLEQIAKRNKTTPMNIFVMIKKHEQRDYPKSEEAVGARQQAGPGEKRAAGDRAPQVAGKTVYTAEMVEERIAGTGIGRKTLAEFCEENKIDLASAKERLKGKGIQSKDTETMKEIAARHNTAPIELAKILLVENGGK